MEKLMSFSLNVFIPLCSSEPVVVLYISASSYDTLSFRCSNLYDDSNNYIQQVLPFHDPFRHTFPLVRIQTLLSPTDTKSCRLYPKV
jgi:hypothetical protein